MLYQLCRAGERFEVGDGPIALGKTPLVIGRGDPSSVEARAPREAGEVLIDDPWISSRHAQISPLERGSSRDGTGRFVVEDLASTNGILVNGVPTKRAPLLHGDLLETGRTFWVYLEESAAEPLLAEPFELGGVSTWTPSFARELAHLLPRVPGPDHVLVCGPAGTGKGFLARTIHVVSGRTGRFVHLDCRERNQARLLVDLFGDRTHAGRLSDAERGTLFLENVDALPLLVQDRLVEVLARRPLAPEPDNSRQSTLAARIVAAMAANVDDAIAEARMRPSLVDALGTTPLRMPTLQQRLPDLGLLLDAFLARAGGAPAISRDACRCVFQHPFRQQVRAMARVIEGAAALAGEPDLQAPGDHRGAIEVAHLPVVVVGAEALRQLLGTPGINAPEHTSEMAMVTTGGDDVSPHLWSGDSDATDATQRWSHFPSRPKESTPAQGAPALPDEPSQPGGPVDVDAVAAALRVAHGNVSAAARALGRPRAIVLRWIREFGLDPGRPPPLK